MRILEPSDKTEALAKNLDTFRRNARNQLKRIFNDLNELLTLPDPPNRPIGFINFEDQGKKTSAARSNP